MTRYARGAAVLLFAFAAVPSARAGLLPVSVTITPENDQFRWTYAIVLPTDSQLQSGDFFTIYDFAGLTATSNEQPAGWTFAVSKVGPTPPLVDPVDDPNVPNLTWKYAGPTIASGQTGLGNFWAVSQYENSADSYFTARTHRTADGRIDTNITDTVVPVPTAPGGGDPDPNVVPEPATLALAALGLPLVGLVRRRLKQVGSGQ